MKIRIASYFFLLLLFSACRVNENFIGKYRSNFATLGFFITEVELKEYNNFHYKFSGDLQHTELDGKYKIENNILYLRFDKLKGDSEENAIKIVGKDTIEDFEKIMNTHSYEIKNENGIEYHIKYFISKQKLKVYNVETNKLVKTVKAYRNGKYHPKRYFLKKIEK